MISDTERLDLLDGYLRALADRQPAVGYRVPRSMDDPPECWVGASKGVDLRQALDRMAAGITEGEG